MNTRVHLLPALIFIPIGLCPLFVGGNLSAIWLVYCAYFSALLMIAYFRENSYSYAAKYKYIILIMLAILAWNLFYLMPGLGLSNIASQRWILGKNVVSETPSDSLLIFFQLLSLVLLFLIVLHLRLKFSTQYLLEWIFWVVSLNVLWSLILLSLPSIPLWVKPIQSHEAFASGGFVNRNSFATYAGLGICMGVALTQHLVFSQSSSRWMNAKLIVIVSLVILETVALFLSGSRMGLISTIFGGLVIWVFGTLHYRKRLFSLILGGILLSALTIAALTFGKESVARFSFADISFEIRVTTYLDALRIFTQKPLIGFGPGSFDLVYASLKEAPSSFAGRWDKAHNSYITLLFEQGVIGFSLYSVLCLSYLIYLVKNRASNPLAFITGMSILVLVATHSLFDFSMEIYAVTLTVVAVLSICLAGLSKADNLARFRNS